MLVEFIFPSKVSDQGLEDLITLALLQQGVALFKSVDVCDRLHVHCQDVCIFAILSEISTYLNNSGKELNGETTRDVPTIIPKSASFIFGMESKNFFGRFSPKKTTDGLIGMFLHF